MTTLTVDQHRTQMMRWLQTGRGYEFLTMATPYLQTCPEDEKVRLLACQEYLKLGLIEPARDLLDAVASPAESRPEIEAIRDSLQSLHGSRIEWSRDSERFDRNLELLSKRGIEVAPLTSAWSAEADSFERFRDQCGHEQVRRQTADGLWRWIPRLGDHRQIAEMREPPDCIHQMTPGPYLFEGLELGWFFERIHRETIDSFHGYSCPLFVVEPHPASLAMTLHLHDWSALLGDRRIYWFFGPTCVADLAQTLENDDDLPTPNRCLRAGSYIEPPPPSAISAIERIAAQRQANVEPALRSLEERYASRDARFWANRYAEAISGNGRPLRILAAVSRHTTFLQYSMRDVQRAFEKLGHKCRVLMEVSDHHVISTARYHQVIREWEPDLFFNIDHLRPEFPEIAPRNLPVLTWDQDGLPTVFTKENIERIGSLDFVAGWSKAKCVAAGCDEQQFLYARIPTCPEQFDGEPLTPEELRRFSCDVSYVSHASQTPLAFHEEERGSTNDPQMQRLLDTLYELLPTYLRKYHVLAGGPSWALLEEAMRRCGVRITSTEKRDRLLSWYLWRLGDRVFRHEALEWVSDWAKRTGRSFRIYGRGWEQHPNLSAFAAGPVDNGRDLLCLYRASRINLQLMPAGFIHQRALDGLASGGFFLARRTPSDSLGKIIHGLVSRAEALGIATTRELLDHDDPEMQSWLKQYGGDWLHAVDHDSNEFLQELRCFVEEPSPDAVFADFESLLFDSADTFAERADCYLEDENKRRRMTEAMRRVVIDRFSYTAAMRKFLESMTAYLQQIAV